MVRQCWRGCELVWRRVGAGAQATWEGIGSVDSVDSADQSQDWAVVRVSVGFPEEMGGGGCAVPYPAVFALGAGRGLGVGRSRVGSRCCQVYCSRSRR